MLIHSPLKVPPPAPGRFAATVRKSNVAGCRVAFVGLADDLGVRLNNGRPGAAGGPVAFREALSVYGVAEPAGWEWPAVCDVGDVIPAPGNDAAALAMTHAAISEIAAGLARAGVIVVGIGGGHDLTFPLVRGVSEVHGPLAGEYFDAHLDVRETVGSGMPFRRLVEECGAGPLRVHGLNALANSKEHTAWFTSHGGTIEKAGASPESLGAGRGKMFVSMDLDVLDASHAPGVSAMNAAGWTVRELEAWAFAAGRDPRVVCFDLMELCPAHDVGGRTARVAAHLFLTFLRGVSERAR